MENLVISNNNISIEAANPLELFARATGLFKSEVRSSENSESEILSSNLDQRLRYEAQSCLGEDFASLKL